MQEKPSTESFYSSVNESDELDLGKVFRFLLLQSKLIIAIVLSAFILSYLNYSFSKKEYLIQSLLQYDSFNQSVFDPSKSLQMASTMPGSDVSSLARLYESRTNFLKVIKDLKLNIDVKDLNNEEKIDIFIDSNNNNNASLRHKLKFSFSESGYSLLNKDFDEIQSAKYGNRIQFNDLSILINSAYLEEYRPIDIHFRYPESMYNNLKGRIDVKTDSSRNSFFSNESLMTVSYVTDDRKLGQNIINYANSIFLDGRISVETEKSRKAIDFIDKNIKSIEGDLEANKVKLKEFREKNKSIDVTLEIEAILSKIESLDESLNSIDVEIAKAQEIYTPNNTVYVNLLNKKKLLESQKENVLSEIEMMPKEQQEYIDLYNDVEISQALFEELESRRLGFSILEASTIGDIRVVDSAYVVRLVSPKLITIIYITFISFIIACLIAIFRGFYFLPISNPAEIFDNNIHIPLIGVIPLADDITSDDDIALNSSIESLIVNINSLNENKLDKNLITITSPTPFNGKSTVSMKLAEGFAKLNKKVLLIDNDLKRGKINKNYNLKSISEDTFNSINETTIENYKVSDNFYVISRVKGLKNTFQFLYNYSYQNKIKFFRDYFDYVIFDTGPILSVSDSSILIELSDINLIIARHEITKINEIKQAIDNFKQINKSVDGIVYNAYAKPNNYFGYYGVYGNYSYQYYAEKYLDDSYEYSKED